MASGRGSVKFTGTIRFTGHGGLLDTRVINPVIQLNGKKATLVVDFDSIGREDAEAGDGTLVRTNAVPFVTFSLAKAKRTASTLVVTHAATTLTKAGHGVFDSYPVG